MRREGELEAPVGLVPGPRGVSENDPVTLQPVFKVLRNCRAGPGSLEILLLIVEWAFLGEGRESRKKEKRQDVTDHDKLNSVCVSYNPSNPEAKGTRNYYIVVRLFSRGSSG